jgi:hypothetical protein
MYPETRVTARGDRDWTAHHGLFVWHTNVLTSDALRCTDIKSQGSLKKALTLDIASRRR